jgi:hypothetical protein
MKKSKVLWVAFLLCVLLLVAFVQVGLARPKAASTDSAVIKTLTIAAADCYPKNDAIQYNNDGYIIRGIYGKGWATFICPVDFPEYGTHTVRLVTIYVLDNVAGVGNDVIVNADRTNHNTGFKDHIGTVRSTGSSSTIPRAFTISGAALTNRNVQPTRGMYLTVSMESHYNLGFFGARIRYSVR